MSVVDADIAVRGLRMAVLYTVGAQAFVNIFGAGGQVQNRNTFANTQLTDGLGVIAALEGAFLILF